MGAMKFFHLEIITFFTDIVFNLIICRVIYLMCVERKSSKRRTTSPPTSDKNYAAVWQCSVEVDELPGADGVFRLRMIILIAIFSTVVSEMLYSHHVSLHYPTRYRKLKTHSKHISLFKFNVLPCWCILFPNYRFSSRSDSSAFGNMKSK